MAAANDLPMKMRFLILALAAGSPALAAPRLAEWSLSLEDRLLLDVSIEEPVKPPEPPKPPPPEFTKGGLATEVVLGGLSWIAIPTVGGLAAIGACAPNCSDGLLVSMAVVALATPALTAWIIDALAESDQQEPSYERTLFYGAAPWLLALVGGFVIVPRFAGPEWDDPWADALFAAPVGALAGAALQIYAANTR